MVHFSEGPRLARTDPGWPRLDTAGLGSPRTVGTRGTHEALHCRWVSKPFVSESEVAKTLLEQSYFSGRSCRPDGRTAGGFKFRVRAMSCATQAGPGWWPGLAPEHRWTISLEINEPFSRDKWTIFPEINVPFPRDKCTISQR